MNNYAPILNRLKPEFSEKLNYVLKSMNRRGWQPDIICISDEVVEFQIKLSAANKSINHPFWQDLKRITFVNGLDWGGNRSEFEKGKVSFPKPEKINIKENIEEQNEYIGTEYSPKLKLKKPRFSDKITEVFLKLFRKIFGFIGYKRFRK
jgi:hypothetical protein